MKDFGLKVDLVEQAHNWYFSLDHQDQREYLYKKRTGLLQREINQDQVSKSIELSSASEAKSFINPPPAARVLKFQDKNISFLPDKILRENEHILNTLRSLKPREWKVIARAKHIERVIIKKGSATPTKEGPSDHLAALLSERRGFPEKEKKTDFTYYSLLIKLRLKGQRDFIEVGEGSVQGLKFNQDGLSSRLEKIVENHRYSKPHSFPDKVPVILNSGDGAIIFHELLGHALEADYIYHHQSPLTPENLGNAIISKNVTLVPHDPSDTFFKEISCDDEGEVAEPSALIENGVLRNLIADRVYKNRLKLKHCGYSRVEDFSKIPMPRMFALYLKPGAHHPEELIDSTPYGVYAGEFGEGKVFFEKNLFYFNIREAWLIKAGKLSDPLGSIMVQGNILEVLNSVEMVANDFRFDKGISYCFKNGQTLNVRVGQPTVKINNLYVTRDREMDE